jgi:hypothetical protein
MCVHFSIGGGAVPDERPERAESETSLKAERSEAGRSLRVCAVSRVRCPPRSRGPALQPSTQLAGSQRARAQQAQPVFTHTTHTYAMYEVRDLGTAYPYKMTNVCAKVNPIRLVKHDAVAAVASTDQCPLRPTPWFMWHAASCGTTKFCSMQGRQHTCGATRHKTGRRLWRGGSTYSSLRQIHGRLNMLDGGPSH